MPRLGELLVAAGLLTVEQVEQALRAQVMWGGRLGTNLVELGHLDLDELAKALGRQHRLPPALSRHFARADRDLQRRLSPELAEKLSCVPLSRIGRHKHIAIVSVAPLEPGALGAVAGELGVAPDQLIASIAAELRIRYHLERAYKIPRGSRYLRARGKSIPPFPHFEIVPVPADSDAALVLPTDTQEVPVVADPEPASARPRPTTHPPPVHDPLRDTLRDAMLDAPRDAMPDAMRDTLRDAIVEPSPLAALAALVALDDDDLDLDAVDDTIEEPRGRDRRKYVRTIADSPSTDSERVAVGRIAIRRVAIVAAPGIGTTVAEATRAIRRSTDRDRVADLVVDTIDRFIPSCAAAILFVVRGDLALGWKGFNRNGNAMPELGVPLDQPGLVVHAVETATCVRAKSGELGPIDQLLLDSLGHATADLAVAPICIGGTVMCVVALIALPEDEMPSAEAIVGAAGAGFARLMRDASR